MYLAWCCPMSLDSLSFNSLNPGDWDGLLWLLALFVLSQLALPVVTALRQRVEGKTAQDFRERLAETLTRNTLIMEQVSSALEDVTEHLSRIRNPEDLSKESAVRMAHKHFDHCNGRLFSFFLQRSLENGIDTNESAISMRYRTFAEDLAPRLRGFLEHNTYNGLALSQFFEGGGASRYCRYMCAELFSIQKLMHDKEAGISVNLVMHGMDRCTSVLLGHFRRFLVDGRTFMDQWDDTNPNFHIIQSLNEPEEL